MVEETLQLFQDCRKEYIFLAQEQSISKGKVLVFAPHPDDETIGCGGTIVRHVSRGDEVKVIVVTDGSKGYRECEIDEYITLRKQEAENAFSLLGVQNYEFLNFEDQGIDISKTTCELFQQKIQEYLPDVIYCPSLHEIHKDHLTTSAIVHTCIKYSSRQFQLLEYEIDNPLAATLLVDITPVIDTKKSALLCYQSQLKAHNIAAKSLALNTYRTVNIADPTIRCIEAFRVTIPNRVLL